MKITKNQVVTEVNISSSDDILNKHVERLKSLTGADVVYVNQPLDIHEDKVYRMASRVIEITDQTVVSNFMSGEIVDTSSFEIQNNTVDTVESILESIFESIVETITESKNKLVFIYCIRIAVVYDPSLSTYKMMVMFRGHY